MLTRIMALCVLLLANLFTLSSCLSAEPALDAKEATERLLLAREYLAAKQFDKSLSEYKWFTENALKVEPSLYPVRLEALSEWKALADQYEPADLALKAALMEAQEAVLNGAENPRDEFALISEINQLYGETRATAECFKKLIKKDREAASTLYSIAQPSLIDSEMFDVCRQFFSPNEAFVRALRAYSVQMELAIRPELSVADRELFFENATMGLLNESATVIALTVKLGDKETARKIAGEVLRLPIDESSSRIVTQALKGEFPPGKTHSGLPSQDPLSI